MPNSTPGVHTPTDPKELYEHLEVLLLATSGMPQAEASLDFLVDALLRACVYHHPEVSEEADELSSAISRWHRTYRPTDRELASDPVTRGETLGGRFRAWLATLPDDDVWGHCHSRDTHPAHTHTVTFNEGSYPDTVCVGTPHLV